MKTSANSHCCDAMDNHLASGELPLEYSPQFREYGLKYQDGGSSVQILSFCPWCGRKLPASLRDRWFDRLDELGLEPNDANIPANMLTEKWWRNLKREKIG